MRLLSTASALLVFLCLSFSFADEWIVQIPPELKEQTLVSFALNDLETTCKKYNISLQVLDADTFHTEQNTILVGNPNENKLTAKLIEQQKIESPKEISPEGFVIQTIRQSASSFTLVLIGGDTIGEAYGLYWILDRLQVYRTIPPINAERVPAFPHRIAFAWGRLSHGGASEEQLRLALRYGFNWVSGPNMLDLIPWNAEPENAANKEKCKEVEKLIDLAHSLGMRYFAFSNDFTYHPSLIDNNEEILNPCMPQFWDKVQEKYRLLFKALPKLDGVEICLDDISGFWDNYQPFDILHEAPSCNMSYEERYQTFLKKADEVIVKECGKTYFHFNWGLRDHEIHCQPEVYKKVFTKEVPQDNLYVKIKITRADRWWFQPYNRTFNLTPHKTIVAFEPMNYYEGPDTFLFPTFSGEYFKDGLQYFLSAENTNVTGLSYIGGISADNWSTMSAYIYTLYRLTWEPNVDIKQIANDYCAINFGPELAEPMANILMNSSNAYKYGLHIEPISYGQFNSLPHIRVGVFVAEGYPHIDMGKGHIQFLRNIYLQCLPWREFTIYQLKFGLDKAVDMGNQFEKIKDKIQPKNLSDKIYMQLYMTQSLIEINSAYVDTIFNFFDYLDNPSETEKNFLSISLARLIELHERIMNLPSNYKLDGVNILIEHAQRAIDNIEFEKGLLRTIPTQKELDTLIQEQQRLYQQIFEKNKDKLKKIAHFEVIIDGQDLLHIKGNQYRIEHLRWDNPQVRYAEFYSPLPEKDMLVIPVSINTRPLHPFVLQQPTTENNYEATIYLDDRPGGYGRFIFDLYGLDESETDIKIIKNWYKYFIQL
ncbi:MAG TPA: hypothetical protein PLX23_02300 [Candidatus Hydrogenedens sp.]|nr:hypothetical protein [Candidatus Hydrogenedens sp.]